MGKTTGISWTEKTWNPWMGCQKISPACAHCYMFRDMPRYGKNPEIVVRSKTTFNAPLKWKEPAKVFTCSWSDFFIEEADAWRNEAWDIIRRTPHLTYQILTKRPERIMGHLPIDWPPSGYPNVWLGVSAENQHFYDIRVPQLMAVSARIHFVSIEPMLTDINIHAAPVPEWIIVGSESGAKRHKRLTEIAWIQNLIEQCGSIPLWIKQIEMEHGLEIDINKFPPAWRIQEFPRL